MIKVLINGACGRMGKEVEKIVEASETMTVAAKVDKMAAESGCYTDINDFSGEADIIIDFSNPAALPQVIALAKSRNLPVVVATTGLSEAQMEAVKALSAKVPVFFSANMSLGINLLSELVKKAAAILGDEFDIEIVEKHHNQKVDAPSGTALLLANSAKEGLSFEPEYVYERHSVRKKREKKEIGISAVRAGTIVGEHDVIFGGRDEVITLSHLAMSKEIFANGAINAAAFLIGKAPGMYSMKDMLDV